MRHVGHVDESAGMQTRIRPCRGRACLMKRVYDSRRSRTEGADRPNVSLKSLRRSSKCLSVHNEHSRDSGVTVLAAGTWGSLSQGFGGQRQNSFASMHEERRGNTTTGGTAFWPRQNSGNSGTTQRFVETAVSSFSESLNGTQNIRITHTHDPSAGPL